MSDLFDRILTVGTGRDAIDAKKFFEFRGAGRNARNGVILACAYRRCDNPVYISLSLYRLFLKGEHTPKCYEHRSIPNSKFPKGRRRS